MSNVHPNVSDACNRFPRQLRRFAPIFLDLLADHSLATHWGDYYTQDVRRYAQACYLALERYQQLLPERGRRFVGYMVDVDLLSHYDDWNHVSDGITSVLRRLSKPLNKAEVFDACKSQSKATDSMLEALYPDLRADLASWDVTAGR